MWLSRISRNPLITLADRKALGTGSSRDIRSRWRDRASRNDCSRSEHQGPLVSSKRPTVGAGGGSGRASERCGSGMEIFVGVELHWYEAHGIGKRDLKIKDYLDKS